ncbi:MAG: glycosyltransferase family 2 protein [Gemmataceae bacterium]
MTALPADVDLTLVSRRPARLAESTIRAVTAGGVPIASRVAGPVRISVVVVTFNGLVFTRMCLSSVLGNTTEPGYELIVVDNASTDGTAEYLAAVVAENPHVRVVRNATNRGFAAANNQGLALAAGDVFVLLNNDTIVPPGWLATLTRHLADPAVGLVGPVTNRIGNEAEIETDYATYGQMLDFAERTRTENAGRGFDIPTPCMFCLALRRDAYDRIGPLDERFAVGLLEDDDYAARARRAGYRLVCAEDAFVHHFGEASFGDLVPTGEYGRLLDANKRRFAEKWGTAWTPYARRPGRSYAELKAAVRRGVERLVPEGATVAVISKGDDELTDLGRRTAWHFPQDRDGGYAGHYPADSAAAVAELESVRAAGCRYLVIPGRSFWWLDHYAGLRRHLDDRCREVARDANVAIYDIAPPA